MAGEQSHKTGRKKTFLEGGSKRKKKAHPLLN